MNSENIKILGKIKNRFDDDRIMLPDDIWINPKYVIRLDKIGEWKKIGKYTDLVVASIIELGVIEDG